MKSLRFIALAGVLIWSGGCKQLLYTNNFPLTPNTLNRATGFTDKNAEFSEGDRVFREGYYHYVQKPKPGEAQPLPEMARGETLRLYDPKPEFYLLVPFAFIGDIVLVPVYVGVGIVVFLSLGTGM
jgi:hypothetical protein